MDLLSFSSLITLLVFVFSIMACCVGYLFSGSASIAGSLVFFTLIMNNSKNVLLQSVIFIVIDYPKRDLLELLLYMSIQYDICNHS